MEKEDIDISIFLSVIGIFCGLLATALVYGGVVLLWVIALLCFCGIAYKVGGSCGR